MKKLILILLFVPFLAMSQDWNPILENQISYFAYPSGQPITDYSNINAIKIDSVRSIGNQEIYYNIRTPRQFAATGEDPFFYFYDPYSSWIGQKMVIENNMLTLVDDQDREYRIDYLASENSSWLYNQDEDGTYVMAIIDSIKYIEILENLFDSVKYISFQAYESNGSLLDAYINNRNISVSKNHGFTSCFYLNPNYFNQSPKWPIGVLNLIGLETDNEKYGFEWDFDDLASAYEINDEIHLTFDYKKESNYGEPSQYIYSGKYITEDYVKYEIKVCAEQLGDEYFTITNMYPLGMMPHQSIFSDNDSLKGFYFVELLHENYINRKAYKLQIYNQLVDTFFMDKQAWMYTSEVTMSGFDPPYRLCSNFHTYIWETGEESIYNLEYFHNQNETWGNPLVFNCSSTGINDDMESRSFISPNPSNGIFNIQSSKKIEELKVFNLNGQLVWQVNELNKTQIDLSSLSEGLYMIKIQLEDNQVINEKIMIQKY